ncbi:MAG TPA: hypothetical protein VGB95_06870 [Chitinophagales bacterium]
MNIRNQLSTFANLFSAKQLISLTEQNVFLPFYHVISNEHLPHISHLYPLRNVKLFEQDLDFFLANFSPISIDELFVITEKNETKKPFFRVPIYR